jgi:leader peptidase (prepilin peptidase)/N-methyltransferase
MAIAIYVLIFFLGAAVGSFLNVLVNRTVEGGDWVTSRSACDYCGKTLAWFDMVPVLSFLWYRGRSRCCKKPLSYQHLVVETLVGVLFVWWVALSAAVFRLVSGPGATVQPLFWLVTGIILLAILVADLYYGVIPLPFLFLGTALVLMYRGVLVIGGDYQLLDLGRSVVTALGAAGFYQGLRVITKGKGMGEGDVWLAGYLGLVLGWPRMLPATMLAFILGATVGVILLVSKRKTMKQTLPFGPFMILGAAIALRWGERIVEIWWR